MKGTSREGVAAEVRATMARQKVTQASLAEAIGVHPVTLSRYLNGHQSFDVDVLYRISDALGVSILDLIPEEAA